MEEGPGMVRRVEGVAPEGFSVMVLILQTVDHLFIRKCF